MVFPAVLLALTGALRAVLVRGDGTGGPEAGGGIFLGDRGGFSAAVGSSGGESEAQAVAISPTQQNGHGSTERRNLPIKKGGRSFALISVGGSKRV
jgi:hypothetical protein